MRPEHTCKPPWSPGTYVDPDAYPYLPRTPHGPHVDFTCECGRAWKVCGLGWEPASTVARTAVRPMAECPHCGHALVEHRPQPTGYRGDLLWFACACGCRVNGSVERCAFGGPSDG